MQKELGYNLASGMLLAEFPRSNTVGVLCMTEDVPFDAGRISPEDPFLFFFLNVLTALMVLP